MRTGIALSLLLTGALFGCSRRAAPHYVERLEVLVPAFAEADALGIRPDRIQAMMSEELKANGHFELPKPEKAGAKPGHPTKLELEVAPIHEGAVDGRVGNYLELEASLLVKRRGDDGWSSYEVGERVQEKISGASLEERQAAATRAIKSALHETVLMADLQLDAVEKSDRQLIRDLNATNPRLSSRSVDRKTEGIGCRRGAKGDWRLGCPARCSGGARADRAGPGKGSQFPARDSVRTGCHRRRGSPGVPVHRRPRT